MIGLHQGIGFRLRASSCEPACRQTGCETAFPQTDSTVQRFNSQTNKQINEFSGRRSLATFVITSAAAERSWQRINESTNQRINESTNQHKYIKALSSGTKLFCNI